MLLCHVKFMDTALYTVLWIKNCLVTCDALYKNRAWDTSIQIDAAGKQEIGVIQSSDRLGNEMLVLGER